MKRKKSNLYTSNPRPYRIEEKLKQLARTSRHRHGDMLHVASAELNSPIEGISPILEKLIKEEAIIFNKKTLMYEPVSNYR